jgi:hypothetical protein
MTDQKNNQQNAEELTESSSGQHEPLVSPRQLTTEEKEFTKMMMTTGVDAEGIVEDEYIETWLLPIERIDMDKRGFIRLHIDNGGTDAEVRLSIDDLKNTLEEFAKMLATG